ncbi:MAG TPA: hypothetical protein VHW02_13395 [Rhizomicrobium sp.]|jgi:hypothetical protein|nr:hypothetical protein [Rhizomicrobium sp.]
MNTSIAFAPHVPDAFLYLLIAAAFIITLYAFLRRARGWWARGIALAIAIAALANPLIVRETREGLPDVVAIIVDHSQSMSVDGRRAQADAAATKLKAQLAKDKSLEIRMADVTTRATGDDNGTQAFAALNTALADVPPDRVAGAIMLTDGEVHDAPAANKLTLHAPLQVLLAGSPGERDRKLTIISAARFAIVGQQVEIVVRADDFGSANTGDADVDVRIDGVDKGTRVVPVGKPATIKVPLTHGGENVIELAAKPGPAELTLQNNRAVVTVSGVRDRLRVLLVSGEPHAGERVWRSLLKSDPSVDLVHFTILRPPDKQDATPITELSLIAFPTRELFAEKLNSFDLVIFDRYRERGILPLAYFDNIARYVENGGALLVSSGPEFAEPLSIYRTPLAAVLPARPTGNVVTQGFKPMVTAKGLAHPVTRDLPGANTADGKQPTWGRWFRLIGADTVHGETLMSGPNDGPLLVLDTVGKGRVAEILSDHSWLWARGYEGGGPVQELLRRIAHWAMKEPELEEERLTASIGNGEIVVERATMADSAKPVTLTYPSGKHTTLTLNKTAPGIFRGTAKADELGLYRLSDGALNAVAAAGPLNPKEVADMRATDAILKPLADATKGSVHWIKDGLPSIRRVPPDRIAGGSDWIGLRQNGTYRVTSVDQQTLLPPWLALVLLLGTLLAAWRFEGR